jgi:uncharacterized protein YwgA
MPANLDKVIACLKYLELTPNAHDYRGRFLMQKIAFLAKALGMDISYHFTIYVAGPYSRELNREYFPDETKTRINSLQTDYVLQESDIVILEKIKNCCKLEGEQQLMEATSTVVYLMKQKPDVSDDELFTQMKWFKPHIRDTERIIAITKAKELLFRDEYMTDEIKREMDEWDRIDENHATN